MQRRQNPPSFPQLTSGFPTFNGNEPLSDDQSKGLTKLAWIADKKITGVDIM